MQIHTFEVSAPLNNENFYKIQKEITSKDKSKWQGEKNGMTYFGLSDKGIIIKMYRIKKKGFYAYSLTYRISARRVIDNDNYVGLFNTKNYPELEEIVNKHLSDKSELLPKLEQCKLRRIDFCVNAKLDNQEQVKAYINTVRRCNIPAYLERYMINGKPTKDDMTIYSDHYVAVSIYNKYKQMKKEKKNIYSDKDFKKAQNIVRIEIRCMEEKVKALKEKYGISDIDEFMANSDMIGKDVFHYYLKRMFGKGTIYTLGAARKRIEISEYSQDNCELLNSFLIDATELRSSAKAINMYKEIYGDKEVKRIIYMLDNIDVNYVTATTAAVKLFDRAFIPRPSELFEDYVK